MEIIRSVKNERVRFVTELVKKRRARYEHGLFVAEGLRLVSDTPAQYIKELFLSETLEEPAVQELARRFPGIPCTRVAEHVMEKMTDTAAPQGVLALVRMPHYGMEDLLKSGRTPLFLILEDIQDPGNLGTMVRTAEAAGVTGIVMSPGCTDLFQPKVIRATMSAVFRVPFYFSDSLSRTIGELKEKDICVYAAYLTGSGSYDKMDYRRGTAFMIGNEARGLTQETAQAADARIRIPMEGQIESLNAAMSAGILMYEAYRQRRQSSL